MLRPRLAHAPISAVLLVVFAVVLALPADAAYTKLYKCKNTTGRSQASLRATNNALEMIVGYTATPTGWRPPVISNVIWSGRYSTRLTFGTLGTPYVAANAYGYVGWRTADNSCRLCDLRWRAPNGALYAVTSATQLQGIPGGGEVQYVDGEYVWLLINDTDEPIDLSNVSLEVLDTVPETVDGLIGLVWPELSMRPQGLMRTMQGEVLPHPDIVHPRVQAVISDQLQPLADSIDDALANQHLTASDHANLTAALSSSRTALVAGDTAYPDPSYEGHWDAAAGHAQTFKDLVGGIEAQQTVLLNASWWPHWNAPAATDVNDDGVMVSYCKPTSNTHYAFLWDTHRGDAGFVDLHEAARLTAQGLGLPGSYLTTARDIDSEGNVVGGAFNWYGGPSIGILWRYLGPGSYQAVGVPPPRGFTTLEFWGINDHGQIAASARDTSGRLRALLYQLPGGSGGDPALVDPDTFPDLNCMPKAINNAGQIAGMYWSVDRYHPFRWDPPSVTGGAARLVIDWNGYWSHCGPSDINEQGQMVGGDYVAGFLWEADAQMTPVHITTIWPSEGAGCGINSVGDAVGFVDGQAVAWDLFSPGYPQRTLHQATWEGPSRAYDVNEARCVAGWCQPTLGGPYYAYYSGIDFLPALPDGLAQQWLDAADVLIAAVEWLPGPAEAVAEELPPPDDPPPPPPPPGDDPTQEYVYESWDTIQSQPDPQLPADSYTAFVVPDSDGVANESLLLKTTIETAPGLEPLLEVVELYTPGDGGVVGADNTNPVIESASVTPDQLWPPNHKMVDMEFDVVTSDLDDAGLPRDSQWYIESVSSNQPVNGKHDGNTEPDWLIDPDDQQVLQLRAERDARDRDGRTYTVVLRAADSSGNLSDPFPVTVLVPRDQGKRNGNMTIASLMALPTGEGAEIVFTLSTDASVEIQVLNIAGRRIRSIVTDRACEAGANTLAWNCRSDRGVMVPSGTYLVHVIARTEDGEQSGRIAPLLLRR